jgi:hypothetical protein
MALVLAYRQEDVNKMATTDSGSDEQKNLPNVLTPEE